MAAPLPRQVAIRPASSSQNRYVALFSAAFADAGWDVAAMHWRAGEFTSERSIVLHWPNEFFRPHGIGAVTLCLARIALMAVSRRTAGVKWVWVVHNLSPHDEAPDGGWIWRAFLRQLDGLIFLSRQSRKEFVAAHPELAATAHLVTRHGDYRTGALTAPSPATPPQGRVRLQFVGLLRPYKNLDALIHVARDLGVELQLGIAGSGSADEIASLERCATGNAAVTLDLHRRAITDAEFERIVDASDAVILPYRQILNSGSAIFALSRNRPVIAPAIGSLPELRDEVGADWLYLYDGDLSADVLRDAGSWLRRPGRPLECALDGYDWRRVGSEVTSFVGAL